MAVESGTNETSAGPRGVAADGTAPAEAHAMRPVAIAFAIANAIVLLVFLALIGTGTLEIGAGDAFAGPHF